MATDVLVSHLLDVDQQRFGEALSRRAMRVQHELADHPLFTLEALAKLADALPPASIERARAKNLPVVVPGGAPAVDGPPSETVRGIETNGCWMVLWYIDRAPEYGALLNGCLDDIAAYTLAREGGMCRREAFLFISAPGSVTPVHIDPEHNFLLQIRGTKEFTAVAFADAASELAELNRYFDGGHRNLTTMPTGKAETFRIAPGEGVYNPPFMPHWVQNGNGVSISLSITFRTRLSQRAEMVHTFNSRCRRLSLPVRPPGRSDGIDRGKETAIRAWFGLLRTARVLGLHGRGRRG